MDYYFKVVMLDTLDKKYHFTSCKDEKEVAELLLHIDTKKFTVVAVERRDDIDTNAKEFYKENKFEKGGE